MNVAQCSGKADAVQPQPLTTTGQRFEPLLTVEQAAQLLGGMHPKTLMRMARGGEVPAAKLGRYWYFRASSLNTWVELSSTRPSVPCQKELS
jgi:excisionase family DNA binding protein